jgi:hypothetical protein
VAPVAVQEILEADLAAPAEVPLQLVQLELGRAGGVSTGV